MERRDGTFKYQGQWPGTGTSDFHGYSGSNHGKQKVYSKYRAFGFTRICLSGLLNLYWYNVIQSFRNDQALRCQVSREVIESFNCHAIFFSAVKEGSYYHTWHFTPACLICQSIIRSSSVSDYFRMYNSYHWTRCMDINRRRLQDFVYKWFYWCSEIWREFLTTTFYGQEIYDEVVIQRDSSKYVCSFAFFFHVDGSFWYHFEDSSTTHLRPI